MNLQNPYILSRDTVGSHGALGSDFCQMLFSPAQRWGPLGRRMDTINSLPLPHLSCLLCCGPEVQGLGSDEDEDGFA